MSSDEQPSPFSYRVRAADVPPSGLTLAIEADQDTRAALAESLGLVSIERLSVTGTVKPWRKDGLRVEATVAARVEQECVVTLDPVWNEISERFVNVFAPPGRERPVAVAEIVVDALEEDPPEPLVGGAVDVGALATEYLALAIDPYPRKPDARLPDGISAVESAAEEEETARRAFGILRELKGGADDDDDI